MTKLTLEGVGVSTPLDYLVSGYLEQNQLVQLLPEWQADSIPLYAVWPENISKHGNVQRMLDYLMK